MVHYFDVKTQMLADFQNCISVPINVFTQENWVIYYLKPMFLSHRNYLFDLHDKLTD